MTQDFLEVIEERYHHKRALAISAQLPVKEWPSVFKDATIADAVLDRIVRNAYRFDLKGPSSICRLTPVMTNQHKASILKTRCHLVCLVQVSCPEVIRTSVRIIQELTSVCYKMLVPNRQE